MPEHPGISRQSSLQSLQSVRKFGDVDTTSGKGFYSSIKSGTVNKSKKPPSVAPPIPSAFGPKKNTWGPPPVRSGSAASGDDDVGQAAPPPPALPGRKVIVRTPEPEPEEEEGEWAETLYAYESAASYFLKLCRGRTIADWNLVCRKPAICLSARANGCASSIARVRVGGHASSMDDLALFLHLISRLFDPRCALAFQRA